MEAETIPTLAAGFIGVIALTVLCIIILWWHHRSLIYTWFIGQVLFLVLGFYYSLRIFELMTIESSMLSEEVSLIIGLSALFWAISMVCMVIGIWKLSKRE